MYMYILLLLHYFLCRDYRWYDSDMVHPSSTTVQLVFDKFASCYLSSAARTTLNDITALLADMGHRPLQPRSIAYKEHLSRTLDKVNKFVIKYDSKIDFSDEIADLTHKISRWSSSQS